MSITRDSVHKHRATGGKRKAFRKKRKFEIGRQPAMTRIGAKIVRLVRCRYGFIKRRALRLETGNFAWPTQGGASRTRILNVVYNASNNELVRTNTLVRNSIVQIDATPFRQWFLKYYGVELNKKLIAKPAPVEEAKPAEEKKAEEAKPEEKKAAGPSKALIAKHNRRQKLYKIDPALEEQFQTGKLLACIASRPGQVGRADGYILEGKELEFYMKKVEKKKKTK